MTSQPSTSNQHTYFEPIPYGNEQLNMMVAYPPIVDYSATAATSSNFVCSRQYFNNSHNRYQFPNLNMPPPHEHHLPLPPQPFEQLFNYRYPAPSAAHQPPQIPHSSSALTSASDSCQQISHVLQCYQQGGEDSEFVRKAIESLVKKLKDKRIELDALITAITSAGKQATCCVTIQRSLDGRLQVAGRKGVPHVVYARIWRWPNVNKNELVKLVQCQTAPDHPDNICINPYHYERVVSNGISSLEPSVLHSESAAAVVKKDFEYGDEFVEWPNSPNFGAHYQCSSHNMQMMHMHQPTFEDRNLDLTRIAVPPPIQPLDYWCSIIYYELDTQIGETFKVSCLEHGKVIIDGGMDPHGENEGRLCLGALSNVHRTEASEKARMHIGDGVELTAHADGNVSLTSKCKVFVRSGFLDYYRGSEEYGGNKAHRFTSADEPCTVFDIRWAYVQMMRRRESSNVAVRAQAAAVAGYAPLSVMPSVMPDSGVDRMRRDFCTIAISFVKGWGDMYPRKSIKETPCWIEVHLHRPLQLLDQLLKNNASSS